MGHFKEYIQEQEEKDFVAEIDEMEYAKAAEVDCTHDTLGDSINDHFKEINRELANIPF